MASISSSRKHKRTYSTHKRKHPSYRLIKQQRRLRREQSNLKRRITCLDKVCSKLQEKYVYALGIAAVATYSEVINVNELPDMVNSFNDVLSVPKEALKYVVPPALALSGSATLQILRMINHLQRKKLDAIRQIRENESTMRILEHAEAHAQKPYNICPNNKLEQIKETESTTDVRPAKNSMQRPITETQEEPDIAKGLRWHFKTNKRNTRGSEDKRKAIGIKNMIYAKAPRGAH